MSAARTPAPWFAQEAERQAGIPDAEWEIGTKDGHWVAVVCGGMEGQQEGNAHLMAASPELLTQLQLSQSTLRSWFMGFGTEGGSCGLCHTTWKGDAEVHSEGCLVRLNAVAIAKATGVAA